MARDRAGLSERQVARRLECSHVWIGKMERGEATVSVAWLSRFAMVYLVSLDWLVFGDPQPPRRTSA